MAAPCENTKLQPFRPPLPELPHPLLQTQVDPGCLQLATRSAAMRLLKGCHKEFISFALLQDPPEVEAQFWRRLSLGKCWHCLLPSGRGCCVAQKHNLQLFSRCQRPLQQ